MPQYERYTAIVTKNDIDAEDGQRRGRIKVKCVGLTGDPDTELPHWIEPTLDWGWFLVPNKDELVEIEFRVSGEQDESRWQSSISDADARWRGKRFFSPQAQEPLKVPPDFTSSYGNQRGFATPFGHVLLFDDTEKTPRVYLTFAKEKVESGKSPDPAKSTQILFDTDGSLKVTSLQNDYLWLRPDTHEIEISLDGAKHILDMKPNECTVTLEGGASMKLEGKDSDAKATFGDGAVKVTIADNFKTWYNNMVKVFLATHVHPTGMGDSGPAKQSAPSWDSSLESTKVKIPNG